MWDYLKETKQINREGLLSLISKLDYEPGEMDESRLIGSLVISLIRLSTEDRLDSGEVGFDFDKKRDALVCSTSIGAYARDLPIVEQLIDSLLEKIHSFGTREIRFVDKGKFVVKNGGTKVVFYRDEDLYRRPHGGYQPSITSDDLDESDPPRDGSAIVRTNS